MRSRIRPLIARRAMRRLSQDPDDTAQAIVVIGAMAGGSGGRLFRRFQRSERGQRLLRERPDLFALLNDTQKLRAMPPGSLGAAIADFYGSERLSAQGLEDASQAARAQSARVAPVSDAEQWFGKRIRDLHDVFHVVTGYGRDLPGEAAVLAFTVGQTRNTGIAYLVYTSLRRAGWRSAHGKLVRGAFKRGLRAEWLVDQDWEKLLDRPLQVVREQLRVGSPVAYEPVRSAGAPALTAQAP